MEPDPMHYDALRNWYTTDSGRVITDEDLCRTVVDAVDADPSVSGSVVSVSGRVVTIEVPARLPAGDR